MSPFIALTCSPLCAVAGATLLLGLATSCDRRNDPSYEKEALRLTAEKASIEANYKMAENNLNTAEATIAGLRAEIATLKQRPPQVVKAAAPEVDIEKIKLGFMQGVDKLKSKVESSKSDHTVESVTFEKLVMPSGRPFSSGVVMNLKSKKTGKQSRLRWDGRGSPKGDWIFEQTFEQVVNPATPIAGIPKVPVTPVNPVKPTPVTPRPGPTRPITRTNANGDRVIKVPAWPEDVNRGKGTTGTAGTPRPGPVPTPTPTPVPPKAVPPKPKPPKKALPPGTIEVDWNKLKK